MPTQKQIGVQIPGVAPTLSPPTPAEAPQIQNTLEETTRAELLARDLTERLKPKKKRIQPVCCCGDPRCTVMEEPLSYIEVEVEE